MTYVTPSQPKRRQPRPLTAEDRLRQEVVTLRAELDRQKTSFDTVVADLQHQHREKVQRVVDETNAYIAALEEKTNADIAVSQQAQVAADEKILAVWQENCRILIDENEQIGVKVAQLEAELARLKKKAGKHSSKKRYRTEQ